MTHYAIGDIHGSLDKLNLLLDRLGDADNLVFLGDYLDKGPDSHAVIERLRALATDVPCTFLRGNHEFAWLNHIHGQNRQTFLQTYGGRETARAYAGHDLSDEECDDLIDDPGSLRDLFGEHLDFLERTGFYAVDKSWLCVHGGILAGFGDADLEMHDPEKLVFARFMRTATSDGWRGRRIICGHTVIGPRPLRHNMAICIDTGASAQDGRLTALNLDGLEFVQDDGTRNIVEQID